MIRVTIWQANNKDGGLEGYFLKNELEMAKAINPDWTFTKVEFDADL